MKRGSTILNRKGLVLFVCAALFGISSNALGQYVGSFVGNYSGDDTGFWFAQFNGNEPGSAASTIVLYSTETGYGDGGEMYFDSEEDTTALFICDDTVINGIYIEAYITTDEGVDASVTGTWENGAESGDLSGSRTTEVTFEGEYSGTLSGDATGTWEMIIYPDGGIYVISVVEDEMLYFEGGANPDGYLVGFGPEVVMYGQISGTIISGYWKTVDGEEGTFDGDEGTFTGTGGSDPNGDDSGDEGDDEGGGGGCFISNLF